MMIETTNTQGEDGIISGVAVLEHSEVTALIYIMILKLWLHHEANGS